MKTARNFFVLALGLSTLAAAATLKYNSVDVTLKKSTGPLTVGYSTRVSPTLGATNPTVKNGVAYVGASHNVGTWNVGLSPKMPLSLNITKETGSNDINLKGLPITRLNMAAGTGPIQLVLPSRSMTANITQTTGSLDIYLPADTGLKLVVNKIDTGSLTIEGAEVASGTSLKGTFQTANYDSAKNKVTLSVALGTGPIEVFKPGAAAPAMNSD